MGSLLTTPLQINVKSYSILYVVVFNFTGFFICLLSVLIVVILNRWEWASPGLLEHQSVSAYLTKTWTEPCSNIGTGINSLDAEGTCWQRQLPDNPQGDYLYWVSVSWRHPQPTIRLFCTGQGGSFNPHCREGSCSSLCTGTAKGPLWSPTAQLQVSLGWKYRREGVAGSGNGHTDLGFMSFQVPGCAFGPINFDYSLPEDSFRAPALDVTHNFTACFLCPHRALSSWVREEEKNLTLVLLSFCQKKSSSLLPPAMGRSRISLRVLKQWGHFILGDSSSLLETTSTPKQNGQALWCPWVLVNSLDYGNKTVKL